MGVILTKARSLAADSVLSSQDVGKLISESLQDGKIGYAEKSDLKKLADELGDKVTQEAKVALNRFLNTMGDSFDGTVAESIFGVSDVQGQKLELAGVGSPADLLIKSRTEVGRAQIAQDSQINMAQITAFAERVDLARTVGVGKTFAAVLHKVDINNVAELAAQDPTELRDKIADFLNTPDGAAITRRRPSNATVEKWVNSAKELPNMIRYVGDGATDFSMESFAKLNNWQKSMLINGMDVKVGDANIFESENLAVDTPSRRPSHIKDVIEGWEADNFGGDYEFLEMASIQRVKNGDDVLGYRVTFDARTDDASGYYGYEYGYESGTGDSFEGEVFVVIDAQGELLSRDDDFDYYGYE
jgi:predicted flap endonuclease-1-like 5' DNA nuclease